MQRKENLVKPCEECLVEASRKDHSYLSNLSQKPKPSDNGCIRYAKNKTQKSQKSHKKKCKNNKCDHSESSYDDVRECLQCKKDWILAANKRVCYLAIPNCLEYSQSSKTKDLFTCSKCAQTFQLGFNGECVLSISIQNCIKYVPNSPNCKECNNGFVLLFNRQKCLPMIYQCVSYSDELTQSGELKCNACEEGFILSVSQTKCLMSVANCAKNYGKENNSGIATCVICQPGLRPTTDAHKCLPNIPNCFTYADSNLSSQYLSCSLCANGLILTTDGRKCLAAIPNCSIYYESDVNTNRLRCRGCVENYELNASSGQCLLSIANCIEYNTENGRPASCRQCRRPYKLASNRLSCLLSVDNCKNLQTTLGKPSYCLECDEGYLLNRLKTICLLSIANCKVYIPASFSENALVCQKCESGYQEANNGLLCLPLISKCVLYQDYASQDNQLLCTKCQRGFQVSSDGLSCIKGIGNCVKYRRSAGSTDYLFCIQCTPDYILATDNSECFAGIAGCNAYDQPNRGTFFLTCLTCAPDLLLSADHRACLPSGNQNPIKNCSVYAHPNILARPKCLVCDNKYVPVNDGSLCVLAIESCNRYGFSLGRFRCLDCENGYFLSSKDQLRCLPKIDNCESYAESDVNTGYSRCVKCANSHVQHALGLYCKPKWHSCYKSVNQSKMQKCGVDHFLGKPISFKRLDDSFYFNFFFKANVGANAVISFNASFYAKNSVWRIVESPGSSTAQKLYNIAPFTESEQTTFVSFDTDFKLTTEANSDDAKWAFFKNDLDFYSIQNQSSKLFLDDLGSEVNCQTPFQISVAENHRMNTVGSGLD